MNLFIAFFDTELATQSPPGGPFFAVEGVFLQSCQFSITCMGFVSEHLITGNCYSLLYENIIHLSQTL